VSPLPLRRALGWNGPLITAAGLALAGFAGLLLTQLTPLDGLLFVGLVVLGGATVIEPMVGLGALLFLGPLRAYLQAEVPQVPAQIAQLFFALTLASWLARGAARREVRIPVTPLLLPLVAFITAALLSLAGGVAPDALAAYGVLELIKWVQVLLLCLFVCDYLTRRRLPWLLGALLLTGLFQAAVGIYQFGLRGDGPDHFAILGGGYYRAYGTFEQPNPYAGYVGVTLALALGVAWGVFRHKLEKVPWSPRLLAPLSSALLVALAMGAALGMSWSRGAWLGFAAAAAVMAVALPRKTEWGLLLAVVLVVGGVGLYATGLLPASVAARLTSFVQDVRFEDVRGVGINDANYAVLERLAHWQAALEMWRHNFWAGIGFGCYEPVYWSFALINWPIALGHAHNYYLNLAAETGLIGLLAYLLLWGAVFWQTWRVTRQAEGIERGVAIGLLGAWTHLTVHHLLDNLYVNNVHLHVGVMLGLLAWLDHSSESTPASA